MKDLRVVIPAYNEEAGIAQVIERLKSSCPAAEILIVDDHSSDSTAQIAKDSNVLVISNETNLGYGKSLKVGFNYHTGSGSSIKYMAFLDADGTYPPENIPEIYQLCSKEGYDIAVGSRLLGKNEGMPFIRLVGNKLFACLASLYTGKKVTDIGTGLRVFNISLLDWVQELPNGLSLTPAMTVEALFKNIAYKEIPIVYASRTGASKLNAFTDGFRFLAAIMKNVRRYRPVVFFITLGIPFLLFEALLKLEY